MIQEGFTLMGIGMGTVFVFLTLLVLLMQLTGIFFQKFERFFPKQEPKTEENTTSLPSEEKGMAALAVAISAAYREKIK